MPTRSDRQTPDRSASRPVDTFQLRPNCHPEAAVLVRWRIASDVFDLHCAFCQRVLFQVAWPIDRTGGTRHPKGRG
jgi:hypothetical protein